MQHIDEYSWMNEVGLVEIYLKIKLDKIKSFLN